MKRFDDLSKAEIAALSYEDVGRYINLACAEEGIPLIPDLPARPVPPEIVPDLEYYQIAGVTVKTMEDAEVIQKAYNRIVTYDRIWNKASGDYHVYSITERRYDDPTRITTIKALSDSLYAQKQKEIEEYKTAKTEYERIEKNFSSIKKQRESTEQFFWDAYREAVEWQRERDQRKKVFAQYLSLADGNVEVAWRFLVKAHPHTEEDYPDLRDELILPQVA
jgi:hypothetical protein